MPFSGCRKIKGVTRSREGRPPSVVRACSKTPKVPASGEKVNLYCVSQRGKIDTVFSRPGNLKIPFFYTLHRAGRCDSRTPLRRRPGGAIPRPGGSPCFCRSGFRPFCLGPIPPYTLLVRGADADTQRQRQTSFLRYSFLLSRGGGRPFKAMGGRAVSLYFFTSPTCPKSCLTRGSGRRIVSGLLAAAAKKRARRSSCVS